MMKLSLFFYHPCYSFSCLFGQQVICTIYLWFLVMEAFCLCFGTIPGGPQGSSQHSAPNDVPGIELTKHVLAFEPSHWHG